MDHLEAMVDKMLEEIPPIGESTVEIPNPASGIILCNPKFPHNVGAAIRAASCFSVPHVIITGNRVPIETPTKKGIRIPREERMKGYKDVTITREDYCLRKLKDVVPVAVEVGLNSESLPNFIHPENAVYVFGPEDGSLERSELSQCHRFLSIPVRHCTNLSAAVYIVLYDRLCKSLNR